MSPDGTRPGVLVAIVGPSGVGKDSLMTAASRHPALDGRVGFARRVVTRVAVATTEDHDSLDEIGFVRAQAAGAFALTWAAHGLRYALPQKVAADVAAGRIIVANLSRRALSDAATVFGRLRIVEVTARPEVLLARLAARGREDLGAVRARLQRQVTVTIPAAAESHLVLDNSDDLRTAAEVLVRHLNRLCSPV